jgi:hypothetical protein
MWYSDIKLTLHTTFNILKGKGNNVITGSFVSPYGKMIYVENHNILLVILNEDNNTPLCCVIPWHGLLVSIRLSVFVELMLIIYIPLYVDTATVTSSRHVTSNGSLSEQGISLSHVPSSLRITSRN